MCKLGKRSLAIYVYICILHMNPSYSHPVYQISTTFSGFLITVYHHSDTVCHHPLNSNYKVLFLIYFCCLHCERINFKEILEQGKPRHIKHLRVAKRCWPLGSTRVAQRRRQELTAFHNLSVSLLPLC